MKLCTLRHLPKSVFSSTSLGSMRWRTLQPLSTPSVSSVILYRSSNTAASGGGNTNTHWKLERYLSVSLLGLVPLGIVYPSPLVDYGLAVVLPIHAHWGVEQILTDYIHPPLLNKTLHFLLYILTFSTLGGLIYFNYTDVGICRAVGKLFIG